ncbi:MAG: MBOAT family protein [Lachnospiraceae bacterium]|nr:MBOAT family protein [Lachnospiraceae bacterium]
MVFSTITFLCVFLPVTILGYYIMPGRLKNIFLVFASFFFYAWGEPAAVWVMLLSVVVNYTLGLCLEKSKGHQKAILAAGVIVNIGILFAYKYSAFVMDTIEDITGAEIAVTRLSLPIGISFYTFQGLSYVIDVYRSKKTEKGSDEQTITAIKNPFELALYISMFPQLIAGPIVRFTQIAGQLKKREHSFEHFSSGAQRFITGLAKKVILANNMGLMADRIFNGDYSIMSCRVAWLGTIAYTLQIYLDFSAYSDMAIGLGEIFGFSFPENFNRPYISKSVSEFWRRWHMTLSGWFRDYVYIPLGGSRRGNVYLNLFIVFILTGIWHGAGWGFLVWGLWHGIFVVAERFFMRNKKPSDDKEKKGLMLLKNAGGHLYTMLVVMIGWTLFRIENIGDFFGYLAVMLGRHGSFSAYGLRYYLSDQAIIYLIISAAVCIIPKRTVAGRWAQNGAVVILKKVITLLLLALCYIYMINSTYNPFIYFRF